MSASQIQWVLEQDVLPELHEKMARSIRACGMSVIPWQDDWKSTGDWPQLTSQRAIFHGSLENAAFVRNEIPWKPGAYCNVERFQCSSWYPSTSRWVFNQPWKVMPAQELIATARSVAHELAAGERLFVRPDSPLKPFSGRVVEVNDISLDRLDFGFYFDDPVLPVLIAPVREVGRESRFVIVNSRVVATSDYVSEGRAASSSDVNDSHSDFAAHVAKSISSPDDVYVMDICESDGRLWLLELNPFSGADLYNCNIDDVVNAVKGVIASVQE